MYGFITLNVKCPVCAKSLMDGENLVDNKPSIHLEVTSRGQNGSISLSAIYDSYNFICDLEVPNGQTAEFHCPYCHAHLSARHNCKLCQADMVPLNLDMGGQVSFCSRRGCRNHRIEFEDLSTALNKFHEDFSYEETQPPKHPKAVIPGAGRKSQDQEENEHKEIIAAGTFLHAYCPYCRRSLIEEEMLKLKVKKGETGYVMLSPYLNVFTSKSTIYLPEEQVIDELLCYHCDEDLIAHGKKCGSCGSPAARISVGARTKLIDFYICTKKGCRWHGLDEDDMFDIKLDDSPEW